jgi:hypothetical protein
MVDVHSHTARATLMFLEQNIMNKALHSLYSLHLASSDYYIGAQAEEKKIKFSIAKSQQVIEALGSYYCLYST